MERRAHDKLDAEVLKAFGLKATASDEEILKSLFQRYSDAIGELKASNRAGTLDLRID